MRIRVSHLALLAGAAGFVGCGDLSGPNHQLTDAEQVFLADQLADAALEGVSSSMVGSPAAPGPTQGAATAPGPITFERSFTMTRPCRDGGTVTTSGTTKGTIDSETHSGTVSVAHTLVMVDCAHTRDDTTITVNTDPSVTLEGTVTIESWHHTSGEFTKKGAFVWETTDGRSGRCDIDLTITWNADGSHSVIGTMCGRDINRSSEKRHRG